MSATIKIPVTIEPDAAKRVAELGMEQELQQMLSYLKQNLRGLHKLRVEKEDRSPMGEAPGIIIWAHREDLEPDYDPTQERFGRWCVDHLHPDVWLQIGLLSIYENADGR